ACFTTCSVGVRKSGRRRSPADTAAANTKPHPPPLEGVLAMLRACLVSLVLISASASLFAQAPAAKSAEAAESYVYVKPAPTGELVDIGGRRLHIDCRGEAEG